MLLDPDRPLRHLAGPAPVLIILAFITLPVSTARAQVNGLPSPTQRPPDSARAVKADAPVLEQGEPVERELAGGETHSYRIRLDAGEYIHVAADQRGIDLVLALSGPDGAWLGEMDGLSGTLGAEELSWEATDAGDFLLEVRPRSERADKGRYQVSLSKASGAGQPERARIAAERLFMEGRRAHEEGRAESWERSTKKYEEALGRWREAGERKWEGRTLNNIGNNYYFLSQIGRAREYYERALATFRAIGDRGGEGLALNNLGLAYGNLGQPDKARDCLEQALAIRRGFKDRYSEGHTLNLLGLLYRTLLGQPDRAREFLEQALAIKREVKDRRGEGEVLFSLGLSYGDLGRYEKAQEFLEQALAIQRENKDKRGEGLTLNNIGNSYSYLGQFSKAREYYEQALATFRAIGDRSGEGLALNNLGLAYGNLGQPDKARDCLEQSLAVGRELKSKYREGHALQDLGSVYRNLGQPDRARGLFEQALSIHRERKDKRNEGGALISLGLAYRDLGQPDRARGLFEQALVIARQFKLRHGEGITFSHLMSAWKDLNRPRLAVLYGKQAVNIYQEIRSNLRGLERESQQSFLHSNDATYRTLADLLIAQGRLPEAQQVLSMLKEDEYFEFIRRSGDESSSLAKRATLSPEEAEWARRYQEVAEQVAAVGAERADLLAKKALMPEEELRLSELEKDLEVANHHFQRFLDELAEEFGRSPEANFRVAALRETRAIQSDLRELGRGAVALYTVVGEEKYRVILVTPDVQLAREYPIGSAEFSRKVLDFREALQNPRADPRRLAQELYHVVVGPVARDLKQARARTLMWSLDGALRYLPVAALHDGERYMVESYRNVVITLASAGRLKDAPGARWRGLGMGVSKGHGSFSSLPSVQDEIHSIIYEEISAGGDKYREARGMLPGRMLIDEAFTKEAMGAELRRRYPLVHIASHFHFEPGTEVDSYLLLGDGSRLTLAEINRAVNMFEGVELLTLSACNTATGGARADGREVEGFGVLAQRQGAKAVLASLWPVADASTRILMQRLYQLKSTQAGLPKAEALRRAQLALLRGEGPGELASGVQRRGVRLKSDAQKLNEGGEGRQRVMSESAGSRTATDSYAHPFYWAPFILIGNWQ